MIILVQLNTGKRPTRQRNIAIDEHKELKPLLQNLDESYKKGKYATVVKNYDKINDIWPAARFCLGKVAMAYYKLKKYPEAIDYLEDSFKWEPPTSEKLILLANCYREAGEFGSAVKYYMQATDSTDAQFQLGLLHMQRKENINALHCFYRVVTKDCMQALAWLKIAQLWIAEEMDNLEEAEFYALKAFGLMQNSEKCLAADLAEAYLVLRDVFVKQQAPQKARFLLDKLEEEKHKLTKYYAMLKKELLALYRHSACFALSPYGKKEILPNIENLFNRQAPKLDISNFKKHFDISHYFQNEPLPQFAYAE